MKPSKCSTERTIVRTHMSVFPSRTAVLLIEHPNRIAHCPDLGRFRLLFIQHIADFSFNAGTFYACRNIRVQSDWFKLLPLRSALPFIRRAHIRFRLYHWLYAQLMPHPNHHLQAVTLKANISQISKVLAGARCLQSLNLNWTETVYQLLNTNQDSDSDSRMANYWKSHIDKIVQPLTTIQPSCTVRKSDVVVIYMHPRGAFGRPSGHATDMENAFSSTIDQLIAARASSTRYKKRGLQTQ